MKLAPDETVLADVTVPLWHLSGAVVNVVLATGVCSMVLGLFDRPAGAELLGVVLPAQWRIGVIGVWALWVLFGFIVPVVGGFLAHTVITDRRIVTRPPGLFARSEEVSMRHVIGVDRRSSDIHLVLYGGQDPLTLRHMPRAKELARRIRWVCGLD